MASTDTRSCVIQPLTTTEGQALALGPTAREPCPSVVVTTSGGHSHCAKPFCKAVIEPLNGGRWRRTKRRYCSDECKLDHRALRRVKDLLDKVGIIEFHELLDRA